MTISAEQKYLLNNRSGRVANKVQLGTLIESASVAGTSDIEDGAVTLAKLAPAVAPSHVVKFAGKHTTVGGAAAEAITVTGVLSTDIVIVSLQSGSTRTIVHAAPTSNTITVTFSDDPSTTHVVSYMVLRATA